MHVWIRAIKMESMEASHELNSPAATKRPTHADLAPFLAEVVRRMWGGASPLPPQKERVVALATGLENLGYEAVVESCRVKLSSPDKSDYSAEWQLWGIRLEPGSIFVSSPFEAWANYVKGYMGFLFAYDPADAPLWELLRVESCAARQIVMDPTEERLFEQELPEVSRLLSELSGQALSASTAPASGKAKKRSL